MKNLLNIFAKKKDNCKPNENQVTEMNNNYNQTISAQQQNNYQANTGVTNRNM